MAASSRNATLSPTGSENTVSNTKLSRRSKSAALKAPAETSRLVRLDCEFGGQNVRVHEPQPNRGQVRSGRMWSFRLHSDRQSPRRSVADQTRRIPSRAWDRPEFPTDESPQGSQLWMRDPRPSSPASSCHGGRESCLISMGPGFALPHSSDSRRFIKPPRHSPRQLWFNACAGHPATNGAGGSSARARSKSGPGVWPP